MELRSSVQDLIPFMDSPEKVYQLFEALGYQGVLDPSYRRKLHEFTLARDLQEEIKTIYTILSFDGKLPIFLVESKTTAPSFLRKATQNFADKYHRLLLIYTTDYRNYQFVFPEYQLIEAGKHKLKITRLSLDRENPYHTDLETLANLAPRGKETWQDVWRGWKEAFSVRRVTQEFFEDYKSVFSKLRDLAERQKIDRKEAHEFALQLLNRVMFIYFIAKKRWLNNDPKFMKWFWRRYKEEKRKGNAEGNSFYQKWLKVLFLEAFNNRFGHPHWLPQDVRNVLQLAPYLNGGLFRRNNLDDLLINLSDGVFEEIFAFFEKYNFTIREDLPLDVEVAVDPQMLGYVYESLANVAEEIYERQDFGIFYTPRVEVDFMCRRALVEYLANHLSEIPKEHIYRLLFDEDKGETERYFTEKGLWYQLEELLDNLAVLDPACGSGAFLVGMLFVLTEIYKLIFAHLDRQMTDYELKKRIVGTTLYGVDVMPWAVHSAELRLWLQLMIESDLTPGDLKIYPLLPNLNLKLRVGDSLVQEIGGMNLHFRDASLPLSVKRKLGELKREKEKYYNSDPTAKFKTEEALLHEELRIFNQILEERVAELHREEQRLKQPLGYDQLSLIDFILCILLGTRPKDGWLHSTAQSLPCS